MNTPLIRRHSLLRPPVLLALLLSLGLVSSCKEDDTPAPPASSTIVDVASGDARFSTLVKAVQKAGLVQTLQEAGPYTVFAPTNDAFTASGINVDALSADQLRPVLLYHVLAGQKFAADFQSGAVTTAGAAPNNQAFVSKNSGGVFINGGTKVIVADVRASNGVIHAIDKVLLPPSKNLVEIAAGNPDFSTLVAAVTKANLAGTLSGNTALTVLAPTNAAFAQLLADLKLASLDDVPVATLTSILLYHVVPGRVFSSDLTNGPVTTAKPSAPNTVAVAVGSDVTVKGASNATASKVTGANILATNGVIHVIDRVLLP